MAPAITKTDKIITLTYLATGNSYRTLQRLFRVSTSAISKFVPVVCNAIHEALKEYIEVR
jgi:hypothetical protein